MFYIQGHISSPHTYDFLAVQRFLPHYFIFSKAGEQQHLLPLNLKDWKKHIVSASGVLIIVVIFQPSSPVNLCNNK